MTMLTRIFMAIAILAGIGTLVLSMEVKKKKIELKESLEKETAARKTAETNYQNEKKAKEDKIAELKKTEGQLAEATAEVERNKAKLAEQDAKIKDVEGKLAVVSKELSESKGQLDQVMAALPKDVAPEQIGPKIKELQEKVAAFEQEKTLLSDQLKNLEVERKRLEAQLITKKTGILPEGVEGRVMHVNEEWNFVVLDIGSKAGLVENAKMLVYRGGNMIGKIKITSVEPGVAVADILPEWRQAQILEGDTVAPSTTL